MVEAADVVVIGSGALGSSTAFHLARAGRKVALLDQHAIASQTSPRAAGLSSQVRHSPLMTRLAVLGVEKIVGFTAETGEPMLYHQPGSLKVARRSEHAAQLKEEVRLGRSHGIDVDFVTAAEAHERMPFLETDGIEAVTWSRHDIYLEPAQLPAGYARAAGVHGAELLPDTRVEEIIVRGGEALGVRTTRGEIRAPIVVDAAGAWLRMVAAGAGAKLPIVATRHQLMITEPIEGVRPEQPITRIIDANVYVRPCEGGLMLGGYEPDPLQLEPANQPPGFSIDDLPLEFAVLSRLADRVRDQLPIFANARVKEHRGGLPTMTPDDEHVVGPLSGVAGLYVIGGCTVGGLTIAPILGQLLAEWIIDGRPSIGLDQLSPARFAGNSYTPIELADLCRWHYAHHYATAASRPPLPGVSPSR